MNRTTVTLNYNDIPKTSYKYVRGVVSVEGAVSWQGTNDEVKPIRWRTIKQKPDSRRTKT